MSQNIRSRVQAVQANIDRACSGINQSPESVKVIAVSIDDSRNAAKVAPFANGKDWPFEIYIDANSDLKRALNVNAIPHTFLLNANKEIVWQHTSYLDGDEEELYEEILKL